MGRLIVVKLALGGEWSTCMQFDCASADLSTATLSEPLRFWLG